MDKLAHEIKNAIARPCFFPEVTRGVPFPCRRYRRVASAAEFPSIKRQETCLLPSELCCYIDEIGVHRKVCKATTVGKERFPRVAVGLVLAHCVFDGLAGEWVFELGSEDGDAVQEKDKIETLLGLDTKMKLADN